MNIFCHFRFSSFRSYLTQMCIEWFLIQHFVAKCVEIASISVNAQSLNDLIKNIWWVQSQYVKIRPDLDDVLFIFAKVRFASVDCGEYIMGWNILRRITYIHARVYVWCIKNQTKHSSKTVLRTSVYYVSIRDSNEFPWQDNCWINHVLFWKYFMSL